MGEAEWLRMALATSDDEAEKLVRRALGVLLLRCAWWILAGESTAAGTVRAVSDSR